MDYPGLHPDPPRDLAVRALPICEAVSFFRTHKIGNAPLFYGRGLTNRYDDPLRRYGVLYLGACENCSFIEVFSQFRIVTARHLEGRALSELRSKRPLRFVDLTEPGGLSRVGADARLFSGAHSIARKWSRAFYDHPANLDGIKYPARHDHTVAAYAVFDKSASFVEMNRHGWLDERHEFRKKLGAILKRYGYKLVESRSLAKKTVGTEKTAQGELDFPG